MGPASSPAPAGPSLVPCLSRVQTEVLTGMSAEQKRWSGRAGGKARTRGARARAGGRGAQAGRGSTEGVRAALPAASGTAAWTRRAPARRRGASLCLWSFPRASPACTRPAPGGATDATSSGPAGPNSLAERRTSGCVQPSPRPRTPPSAPGLRGSASRRRPPFSVVALSTPHARPLGAPDARRAAGPACGVPLELGACTEPVADASAPAAASRWPGRRVPVSRPRRPQPPALPS